MAFPTHPLSETEEAEAKVLAERIREAATEDFLQLARLPVGKPTRELFGQTEFQVRDILLRAGAQAYTQYLAEKKRPRQVQHRLSPLPANRAIPRLPQQRPHESAR